MRCCFPKRVNDVLLPFGLYLFVRDMFTVIAPNRCQAYEVSSPQAGNRSLYNHLTAGTLTDFEHDAASHGFIGGMTHLFLNYRRFFLPPYLNTQGLLQTDITSLFHDA